MSEKITWEDVGKIHEAFQELKKALLNIEPYGVQWKALELLKEAREETSFALLFADAENPFLTNEAKNKMKLEYLEKESKLLGKTWRETRDHERLLRIYEKWLKWKNEPCSSGMRTLDELESRVMHEVHEVMKEIHKEENGER